MASVDEQEIATLALDLRKTLNEQFGAAYVDRVMRKHPKLFCTVCRRAFLAGKEVAQREARQARRAGVPEVEVEE